MPTDYLFVLVLIFDGIVEC